MPNTFLDALSQGQLLDTMPSGLFLVDNNRRIVYWNNEAEKITGYLASETIGRHCSFLEGIECGNICGLFDEGGPKKPVIGAECCIRIKSGKLITISKNVDLLIKDGTIIGGIESFIDISQQKELEASLRRHGENLEKIVNERTAELQAERARLRSVLDEMPDPAYIVTSDYQISFLNRAMGRIIGDDESSICYKTIQNQDKPCSNCPMETTREGIPVHEERRFGPDSRHFEIIHTPLNTPRGTLQKLAVCRDISERKETADKLIEMNKRLDSFAQTISHDLRSPLTGIICYSELIRTNYAKALGGEGLELLSKVTEQGQRMQKMIESMLHFATAGQVEPTAASINTNLVIDKVLSDNKFEIQNKKIHISTADLPQLSIPESLAYELFSNLLLNAVRYGCKHGDPIEVEGKTEKTFHAIAVIDHGPGLPEEERSSIFKTFVRGSTSGHTHGTGIGLATVRKIAQSYGGDVQLSATHLGGCTFTVYLPTG